MGRASGCPAPALRCAGEVYSVGFGGRAVSLGVVSPHPIQISCAVLCYTILYYTNTVCSFTYTHNVAKVTNRRYRYISNNATSDVNLDVDVDVDIDDGMRIRKLDIYMGYTEDILKLCARIADLPTLDRAGLDVEVANMYVVLILPQSSVLLRSNTTYYMLSSWSLETRDHSDTDDNVIIATTPSKSGPQPRHRNPTSCHADSPREPGPVCRPWLNVSATRRISIYIPCWSEYRSSHSHSHSHSSRPIPRV